MRKEIKEAGAPMSAVRLLESIVRDMKKQLADHTAEHEAVRLQLAASKDAYDELESRHNDTLAALATVQGERKRLLKALEQIDYHLAQSQDDETPANQYMPSKAELVSCQSIIKAALAQPAEQEVKE